MLKVPCYIEDKDSFEYIAVSESGRLSTRTQNPFAAIPAIQDLERVLKARLETAEMKPDGLAELIEEVRQHNETVTVYERVRYVKTVTPELVSAINQARAQCDSRAHIRSQQSQNTIIDMKLKVVKVEKDGE
jgi:hypothetical protein